MFPSRYCSFSQRGWLHYSLSTGFYFSVVEAFFASAFFPEINLQGNVVCKFCIITLRYFHMSLSPFSDFSCWTTCFYQTGYHQVLFISCTYPIALIQCTYCHSGVSTLYERNLMTSFIETCIPAWQTWGWWQWCEVTIKNCVFQQHIRMLQYTTVNILWPFF
jgi:hypothetical protein